VHSWYVVATSEEIGTTPLGRRALDSSLVLYRTSDGRVAVLEDRDAHRPYPLSLGHVENDLIVSGYTGFAYAADGGCVRVPTQTEVPYGARVRAFPAKEQDGLVWVWFGEPGRAHLRRPPSARWLVEPEWSTFGGSWSTAANLLLLHENFADITHVAVVDPVIAPPVLTSGPVPLLEVEVTETTVSFQREYPPARLASWHAPLVGVEDDSAHVQREEGRFASPGLWLDSWEVHTERDDRKEPFTFRFTHAVTPVDRSTTRHVWRVSRNFAPGEAVSANLLPLFTQYYERVRSILETMQGVLDRDGWRHDVQVSADVAMLQVRKIMRQLVEEESGRPG
jgi:vanillate O-demethylase monooxygenase subunit